MVTTQSNNGAHHHPRVLIVGNHCHDVLEHGVTRTESLGGAAAFISNVFDGLSIPFQLVSKVGGDFRYPTVASQPPIVVPSAKTTFFHACFRKTSPDDHPERILRRVTACEPITPGDLPVGSWFDFGMAVGVGGEVLPETLERMFDICGVVFADVQAMIRGFEEKTGTVLHLPLKHSGFYHLLPRIGGIKASLEEAACVETENVSTSGCCVVVTTGSNGCRVYWQGGNFVVPPFSAIEVDPTGAGDSFLGGFVGGLVHGLCVPDAALLGNLFGSLAVQQVGLPAFDSLFLQRVREEVQKRKAQYKSCEGGDSSLEFLERAGDEQFYCSLQMAKLLAYSSGQERQRGLPPTEMVNGAVAQISSSTARLAK